MLVSQLTDYTDKDFDSLRFRLRNLIRSVFPEWTDFNVANFGNILVELYAHVGDILLFYQDNQARQSRIVTATQRKALLGLVKLIGYEAATATPATADVALTLAASPAGSVLIPKGTFIYTEEVTSPIRYQTMGDVTFPANMATPTITVAAENSETKEQVFASTGLPNQSDVLSSTPYIDGTAVIIAGNGVYTEVDNFLTSQPADRHFTVVVDQNDRASVRYGNGVNGAIPIGNRTASYRIGGGAAGRVEAAKLKRVDGNFQDSLGNTVTITSSNASPSSGGNDRQSVAQIKERAPASLRVLNRTVAREDFEINALRLTDVARALMTTSNEDPGVQENNGILYIVPVGGGAASTLLKDAVKTQVTVTYPCTLTFSTDVQTAPYKTVNVHATVYFRKGATKSTVAANIRAALAAFFAPQNPDGTTNTLIDFGANMRNVDGDIESLLPWSDIFNLVHDVTGVRKLTPNDADFTLNGQAHDVALARNEFPKLGTVELIDGDTGTTL